MAGCDNTLTQVLFERMMIMRATDNAVDQVSYRTANQRIVGMMTVKGCRIMHY